MGDISVHILVLSAVALIGLFIGSFRVKGVSLGIGGVLFGGLIVGHFAQHFDLKLDNHILHFIREFGLILFIYAVGIQVGPGFFSSLKSEGLKFNLIALIFLLLGFFVTAMVPIYWFSVDLPAGLGIFSGAVTNTPSLAAGQQVLTELGLSVDQINQVSLAYAMTYPFGVFGLLLALWLLKTIFKINTDQEALNFDEHLKKNQPGLASLNLMLTNPNLIGLRVSDFLNRMDQKILCSRLKREGQLIVPKNDLILKQDDILHLVGSEEDLKKFQPFVGSKVDVSLTTQGVAGLKVGQIVLTNEHFIGKKLQELALPEFDEVVISRIYRSGIELIPSKQCKLQFGDILNIVGGSESFDLISKKMGNSKVKLEQVHVFPIFIGVALGVLLGSLPIQLPGFSVPLKLGLAGGPLLVSLLLSRLGSFKKIHWFMPTSANHAFRELGIVLFLSVVGLKSGAFFWETLINGNGLSWMGMGVLVTLIPLLVTGSIAWLFMKVNFMTLCGIFSGAMTNPPGLAFLNSLYPDNRAASYAYATVYPFAMILRIISPQILALMFLF